jgi:hypothetical protein
MEIVNHTPLRHFAFESRTPDDEAHAVVVVRGTFAIDDGRPLRPLPRQEPVRLVSEHRGSPASSSLRADTDLAPFKPRADIHIDAVARAPGGRPAPSWAVRIRVGNRTKDLMVRGPYEWRRRAMRGWVASKPEPCTEVPLIYEHAFGGTVWIGDEEHVDEHNPVGAGWIPRDLPRDRVIRGARVIGPGFDDDPTMARRPEGVGPVPPGWLPRRARAGTFDEAWRRERWPRMPADFDYRFYNSAHDDLVCDGYLRGDERIELVHLGPNGSTISTRLPAMRVFGLGWLANGAFGPLVLRLDTLFLDVASADCSTHRAYLTWRGICSASDVVRVIEIRMEQPERGRERSLKLERSDGG